MRRPVTCLLLMALAAVGVTITAAGCGFGRADDTGRPIQVSTGAGSARTATPPPATLDARPPTPAATPARRPTAVLPTRLSG